MQKKHQKHNRAISYFLLHIMGLIIFLVTLSFAGLGFARIAKAENIENADYLSCLAAAQLAEVQAGLPESLLSAIALVESGRTNPLNKKYEAWPFAVTIAGKGNYYPNLESAKIAVKNALKNNIENIDIGCMQINYKYHAAAFDNLDEFFSPLHNVAYAASFLRELYRRHGDWGIAVSFYHSSDAQRQYAYQGRVLKKWDEMRHDIEVVNIAPTIIAELETIPADIKPAPTNQDTLAQLELAPAHQDSYVQQNLMEIRARQRALSPPPSNMN